MTEWTSLRLSRRTIFLWVLAVGVAAGLTWGLRRAPRPNLLLVTLDTTRADRLGCYGYSAACTPALDALAASGVVCDRARTVAPLTLPAHASLFTGLYPAETGVRTNGRGRLEDSIPTLAELLHRRGYDNAAFIGSFVLNGKFGLARGFETYDDDFSGDEPAPDELHRERHGASVVDAALEWLGRKRSLPFFCWVHLFDPHSPYALHADLFGDEYADRPYDAEIAYVDRQVARLVDFLKVRGLDSETLVVIVGDHGEGLGEHLERNHGMTLYETTVRVPLIFRNPSRLPAGSRVATPVSMVDVTPTILDLLGLAIPPGMTGRNVRPALAGRDLPPALSYGATDEAFLVNGCAPLRSLTDGRWKYIRTTRAELYDLERDPQEQRNLADTDPDRRRAMELRLGEFEAQLLPRADVQVQISGAERRALASLGYAGGAAALPVVSATANLPDVKEMLPCDIAVEEAGNLLKKGSTKAGIERLRKTVGLAPWHTQANWSLAWALWESGEREEALHVLRSLATLKPDCRDAHYGLGRMLAQTGPLESAISEYTRTLEIDPEHAEAHFHLARTLAGSGRPREALDHFDALLRIDPQSTSGFKFRAYLLAGLGNNDAAIADYRMALKYSPDSAELHHNLGALLADHGAPDDARRHLVRAVELDPHSAECHYALGALFFRERRYEDAAGHLAEALKIRPGYEAARQLLEETRQALRQ